MFACCVYYKVCEKDEEDDAKNEEEIGLFESIR